MSQNLIDSGGSLTRREREKLAHRIEEIGRLLGGGIKKTEHRGFTFHQVEIRYDFCLSYPHCHASIQTNLAT